MNPKATQYANSKVPNPDRNDAPYFTSQDRWQDVYEAYEAGEKSRQNLKEELIHLKRNKDVYIIKLGEAVFQSEIDIECEGLTYCEPWGTHEGLQCNFSGDSKSYDKIFDYCRKISELIKDMHKLNNNL